MVQNHVDKFNDSDLLLAYKEEPHLGKLAVRFNVPSITIWRRAHVLGLKFENGGARKSIPLEEILDGKHPHLPTMKVKRKLLKEGLFENKCGVCGITDWNGNPLAMELDHIDGNCHNHRLENLRMICPNCHAQTDTYCGKNKV